ECGLLGLGDDLARPRVRHLLDQRGLPQRLGHRRPQLLLLLAVRLDLRPRSAELLLEPAVVAPQRVESLVQLPDRLLELVEGVLDITATVATPEPSVPKRGSRVLGLNTHRSFSTRPTRRPLLGSRLSAGGGTRPQPPPP